MNLLINNNIYINILKENNKSALELKMVDAGRVILPFGPIFLSCQFKRSSLSSDESLVWNQWTESFFRHKLRIMTNAIQIQTVHTKSEIKYITLNYDKAQSYEHICPCNCYTLLYILSSNRVIILLTIQLTSFFLTKPFFACINQISFLAPFCDDRKTPMVG